MFKQIRFDESGCAYGQKPPWDMDGVRKNNFVSFSNQIILNQWAKRDHVFQLGTNGVCSENFFEPIPWYFKFNTSHRIRYWWGNDCLKKLDKCDQKDLVTGACPFVYSSELFDTRPRTQRFQAVFLPKADACDDARDDFTMRTELNTDSEKVDRFLATIENLKIKNPMFIAFPPDYSYWEEKLPSAMRSRVFSVGFGRYDPNWNRSMIEVFKHCDELYFHMISTPSIYASYMGKKVKFYDSELLRLEDKHVVEGEPVYTLDKNRKPAIYHEFMEYITDTFENKTSDLGYWLRQFLSLDLIKSHDEIARDLLTLETRHGNIKSRVPSKDDIMRQYGVFQETKSREFDSLVAKVNSIDNNPSDTALYYFNLL